jgi:hypothetical protein
MQLSGPNVFGPPKDRAVALSVLREAVASDPYFRSAADLRNSSRRLCPTWRSG